MRYLADPPPHSIRRQRLQGVGRAGWVDGARGWRV